MVALFTPGWRSFKGPGAPFFGLVTLDCGNGNRYVIRPDCHEWFRYKSTFEKVTLACMILAALLELVCVISFVLIFAKARYRLAAPAAAMCGLAALLLAIAIIWYAIKFDSKTMYMQSTSYEMIHNAHLGYSWYLTIVAFIFVLAAAAAAGATRAFAIVDTRPPEIDPT
ncbi:unnamed protein product, partial [Mesorhabditis belari]|uniref:Uncharacterized protein n=1 Tax=Mesorhabditis belari TaxID=2138241 RepID=A0AAF3EWC6_9BILA